MASVRVTVGGIGGSKFPSHDKGDPTGLSLNTFGLQKLESSITGERMVPILMRAIELPKEQVEENWPNDTYASIETLRVEVDEVGPHMARIILTIGGPQLIEDPRNKKHIDYTPFVEFNGSPAGRGMGTFSRAFAVTQQDMADIIHAGVEEMIAESLI